MQKSKHNIPPRMAQWILKRFSSQYNNTAAPGDLEEEFFLICKEKDSKKAKNWYRRQVLKSIPGEIKHIFIWSFAMFKNYLKTSFRNIKRQKIHSFINITGLAIGIACAILVYFYIRYELSFDKYHENAGRIYRLNLEMDYGDRIRTTARSSPPMGPALSEDFPEIKDFVRLFRRTPVVGYGVRHFYETVFFADQSIFNIFSFNLKKGSPESALKEPRSIVLTEKMAKKYFGNENPIGKTLTIWETRVFTVTGILQDIPPNSHFAFDFLASWNSFNIKDGRTAAAGKTGNWMHLNYYTYILLDKNSSPENLGIKIEDYLRKYLEKDIADRNKIRLQPLSKIHLYSNLSGEINPNNDISNIYIFGGVSLFIIIIACINYINLSTAKFISRSKEVGIRKTVGAHRLQLIRQFFTETFLFTFISFLLGILLVVLILPKYNSLIGKSLSLDYLKNITFIITSCFTILFIGFAAGSYPAFLLSSFDPVKVLKSASILGVKGLNFRRFLVTSQFAISITFIAITLIVYNQLNYLKNTKIGFDKEYIIKIPIYDKTSMTRCESLKAEFLKNPNVINVSSSSFFSRDTYRQNYSCEGVKDDEYPMINWLKVDHNFLKTFGIELVQGRDFSKDFSGDPYKSYILNESAVKMLGWKNPIGKEFQIHDRGTVIGVVKDFHFMSLHKKIEPLAIRVYPENYSNFFIRLRPENISTTINFVKKSWEKLVPGQMFEYSFFDEDYDKLYKSEEQLIRIFSYVTFLAVFIACLGLFGLSAFTAESRTKEIGIRKIMGASITNILKLLLKEYAFLIIISTIISVPAALYFMNRWLENFAYKTNISIYIFVNAGILALAIAVITVGFHAVKAAIKNPVDSLRYE
ncbi:ABC transporter permease [candidate division KSB1 bacterium]